MGCCQSSRDDNSVETWLLRYDREEKEKRKKAQQLRNLEILSIKGNSYIKLLESLVDEKEIVNHNQNVCLHPYIFQSRGIYQCYDCGLKLNQIGRRVDDNINFNNMACSPCIEARRDDYYEVDINDLVIVEGCQERIMKEVAAEKEQLGAIENQNDPNTYRPGIHSEFLLNMTIAFDCWHWSINEVVRKIILPVTSKYRCSLVEIPDFISSVGKPQIYVCYPYRSDSKWGDVVAAIQSLIGTTSDRGKFIYLDAFCESQWSGGVKWSPSQFNAVIKTCSSLLVVCPTVREIQHIVWTEYCAGRQPLSNMIRRQVPFENYRCLYEIYYASSLLSKTMFMKCGCYDFNKESLKATFQDDTSIFNGKMFFKLPYFVNVSASMDLCNYDDEFKALSAIRTNVNGETHVEDTVKDVIKRFYYSSCLSTLISMSSYSTKVGDREKVVDCSLVDRAALGNEEAIKYVKTGSDDFKAAITVYMAAAGYSELLNLTLDSDIISCKDIFGWTPLMYATRGGNLNCIQIIIGKTNSTSRAKSLIRQKNNLGEDAISIAKMYNQLKCGIELSKFV